ncbi:hypothetical protein LSO9J_20101 [Candidatus Liberibacter solanacearum]
MLSPTVQQYMTTTLGEYPIIKEIITNQKFNNTIYSQELHAKSLSDIIKVQNILIDHGLIKNTER